MKILNFGSLNLDYVYSVDHIVAPGETISSSGLELFCGGKGLNQSIALARAGATVFHAGLVGPDGGPLLDACRKNGVNIEHIREIEQRSGNAIIQLSSKGQNSIVLFGGANEQNSENFVDEVFSNFGKGDLLLLQNEVNLLSYMIKKASEKGMIIALNPSPFNDVVLNCDLSKVTYFFVNEVEGAQITCRQNSNQILSEMMKKYPASKVILTLGSAGAIYNDANETHREGVFDVKVVDTTAAGDTFTGYFLAYTASGKSPREALHFASVASSLAVSKKGATDSIPLKNEVEEARLSYYSKDDSQV